MIHEVIDTCIADTANDAKTQHANLTSSCVAIIQQNIKISTEHDKLTSDVPKYAASSWKSFDLRAKWILGNKAVLKMLKRTYFKFNLSANKQQQWTQNKNYHS